MTAKKPCEQDACPIAQNMDMTRATPAEKKATAEALYKAGTWTPERLAEKLGVSLATVYRYLEFSYDEKIKTAKTDTNPKGAGRKKGSKKQRPNADKIVAMRDSGMTAKNIATDLGYKNERTVHTTLREEEIRREAEAQINPATLSATAQQKLDSAIKQQSRKLNQEFDVRVLAEVERRLDTLALPAWKERIEWAEAILKRDKGVITAAEYKLLRSCLHPDRVQDSDLKRKYAEAFSIIEKLEKFLCKPEKEPPAKFPRTWREAQSPASEKRGHLNGQ